MPQAAFANLRSYADGVAGPFIPLIESSESEIVQQNIDRFEKLGRSNGIDYLTHKDFDDFVIPELRKESLYADLFILGNEVFYENMGTVAPNDCLKESLHDVKCPVILVPEKFDFPKNIILAYDGGDGSVIIAIKQFAYLFPSMTSKKALMVNDSDDPSEDFPDKIPIEELATRHFSDLTMFKLDINPGKYFSYWVSEKKSSILVCGSYGRSGISPLFRKSFVKDVLVDHCLPVFIAHK